MADNKNRKINSPVYWIGIIVTFLCLFVLPAIMQPWAPMVTHEGVAVTCIFAGVIIGILTTGDLMLCAFMSMCALVCAGVFNAKGVVGAYIGSTTVWQVITLFAVCYVITRDGTGEVIAKKILALPFIQGRPMLLIMMLMATFSVASVFLRAWGCLIIGFPLLASICKEADIDLDTPLARLLYLGNFICMCTGQRMQGFMDANNVSVAGYFTDSVGVTYAGWEYTVYSFLILTVFIIMYALSMKYIFKCDINKLTNIDLKKLIGEEKPKLSKKQMIPLLAFLFIAIYTFGAAYLPQDIAVFHMISSVGTSLIVTAVICVLAMVRVDGEQIFNIAEAFKKGINWPIVMAIASLSTIGAQLVSDDFGVKAWFVSVLGGFSNMNPVMMVIVTIVLTIALTNFFSNTATQYVVAALSASLSGPLAAAGLNIAVLPVVISLSAAVAFLTYPASGQAAILLSEKHMTNKFVWTYGLGVLLIWIIACSIVAGIVLML